MPAFGYLNEDQVRAFLNLGTAAGADTGDFASPADVATVASDLSAFETAQAAATALKLNKAVSAASRLLGRGSSGAGDAEELSLGPGAGLDGTTLYASPSSFIMPFTGNYLDACQVAAAVTTVALVANRLQMHPLPPLPVDITIDRLEMNVTATGAGTLAKVVLYEANTTTGWPGILLTESADLDITTLGAKVHAYSATLKKGKLYWLGVRANGGVTVTGLPVASLRPLGRASATGANFVQINSSLSYATAATSPYGTPGAGALASTVPPAVFPRMA